MTRLNQPPSNRNQQARRSVYKTAPFFKKNTNRNTQTHWGAGTLSVWNSKRKKAAAVSYLCRHVAVRGCGMRPVLKKTAVCSCCAGQRDYTQPGRKDQRHERACTCRCATGAREVSRDAGGREGARGGVMITRGFMLRREHTPFALRCSFLKVRLWSVLALLPAGFLL